MKPAQQTVLGLLIVLLALEAVRNKNVQGFLKTWLGNFRQAINSTPTGGGSNGSGQDSGFNNGQQQPSWLTQRRPTWQ